jgi:uncharacterized protein DUF6852/uncharacterized protein DUF5606
MSLKKIISVGGMSGLYKVITQTKTGFVIESLNDQKRTIVQSTQKISTLEDISIYTVSGEKPLKDVLLLMKEKENIPVHPKSEPGELKKFFKTIVPDYDEERVYVSDIKKIILWYGLLKEIINQKDEGPAEKIGEEIKVSSLTSEKKPENSQEEKS